MMADEHMQMVEPDDEFDDTFTIRLKEGDIAWAQRVRGIPDRGAHLVATRLNRIPRSVLYAAMKELEDVKLQAARSALIEVLTEIENEMEERMLLGRITKRS